jgi:GAF domain-containing protein
VAARTAAVAELDLRADAQRPTGHQWSRDRGNQVYSGQPAAYSARAERLLELFARQAAILLSNTQALADARRLSAQLIEALNNRDIIAQAQGVLIAQGAANDQAAFAMLATASQRSNTKLTEVARRVIASAISRNPSRSGT